MAEILAVVPEEGIRDTGIISYAFIARAELPLATLERPFGVLSRVAKGPDYIEPFGAVRGEPGSTGDDGSPLWRIDLFRMGQGWIAHGHVDTADGVPALQDFLEEVPDCTLLVPPQDTEVLIAACEASETALTVRRYAGSLATG